MICNANSGASVCAPIISGCKGGVATARGIRPRATHHMASTTVIIAETRKNRRLSALPRIYLRGIATLYRTIYSAIRWRRQTRRRMGEVRGASGLDEQGLHGQSATNPMAERNTLL